LEGIHELVKNLQPQSTAVQADMEAATRVEKQKKERQDDKNKTDCYGKKSEWKMSRAKIFYIAIPGLEIMA